MGINRHLLSLGLIGALGPMAPASAQDEALCQELWLSRATVLDRAGQCFETALGQTLFDNSNCFTGTPRLLPLPSEIVRRIEQVEAWAGCAVDETAISLPPEAARFVERLQQLETVPIRVPDISACDGYRGAPRPLYAGISTSLAQIGVLEPGQNFSIAHYALLPGWEFIQTSDQDGAPLQFGWAQGLEITLEMCAQVAG